MKKTLRDSGTFGKGPINVVLRARKEFELILNKWVVHVMGLLSFISLCFLGNEISKSLTIAMISFLIIGFYSINRKRNKNDSLWLFSYIMSSISLHAYYWFGINYSMYYLFVALGIFVSVIIYKVNYIDILFFPITCVFALMFADKGFFLLAYVAYVRDLVIHY